MPEGLLRVKDTVFGDETPKICVPLTASDPGMWKRSLDWLDEGCFDLVEWRYDYCVGRDIVSSAWGMTIREMSDQIRERIGNKPMLFTCRTNTEGGRAEITQEAYGRIAVEAALAGADLVDLEWRLAGGVGAGLADRVREAGAFVVGSFHDFSGTPSVDEMIEILKGMQRGGMDMTKLAVMPQTRLDVIHLLEASVIMKQQEADRPFITIAMGKEGLVSRVFAGMTGSAVTFASGPEASAPGQMDARELASVLEIIGDRDNKGFI